MRRVVLIAALAAAACDHPPVKEIAAAAQQVELARTAGAERYAPDRWGEAEAALALARQRLEGRDYQGALSAANDASESARVAIEAITPAKAVVRKAGEDAVGQIQVVLDRAGTERTAALKAGVPARALADPDARAQRAAEQLSVAVRHLGGGTLDDVEPLLADLRTEATLLPGLYRDARTQWEARRRPRARRGVRR